MIVVNCKHGSDEWREARLAIPTASQFHRILQPKKLQPSAQAESYTHELLAELMLGRPIDDYESQFMVRGTAMEQSAIDFYEFDRDVKTTEVGFILSDDMRVGCSPDRLVGDDGGLEIKCPSAKEHVGYMLGKDADIYRCQIQGSLWITGRQWWDWLSYNPDLPPVLIRHQRDEEFIAKLSDAVYFFLGQFEAARQELILRDYIKPATIDYRSKRLRELAGISLTTTA